MKENPINQMSSDFCLMFWKGQYDTLQNFSDSFSEIHSPQNESPYCKMLVKELHVSETGKLIETILKLHCHYVLFQLIEAALIIYELSEVKLVFPKMA